MKLFCQGTTSLRQWKRIRDTRDNLSLSRIKACVAHFWCLRFFKFTNNSLKFIYQQHSCFWICFTLCFISQRFYNYLYFPCTKYNESIHNDFNRHLFICVQCYSFGQYRKLHFVQLASTRPLNSNKIAMLEYYTHFSYCLINWEYSVQLK